MTIQFFGLQVEQGLAELRVEREADPQRTLRARLAAQAAMFAPALGLLKFF